MFGPTRNILMGMSLAYSYEKEKYLHFLFLSIYTGYHIFKNKEDIRN